MTKARSYKNDLLKALTDLIEAKEYLNAALEDDDPEVFLLAVQDVFEANSDAVQSAKTDNLNEQILLDMPKNNNSQLNDIRDF